MSQYKNVDLEAYDYIVKIYGYEYGLTLSEYLALDVDTRVNLNIAIREIINNSDKPGFQQLLETENQERTNNFPLIP